MWLIPPSMSFRSAQESAGSTLGSDLLFPALAASAWSKGKPLPAPSWQRAWTKARWIQHLSGWVTSDSLTPGHGAASWIASQAAIPASPTASPGFAKAPMTNASLSIRSSGSFRSAGLLVCSERTSRGTRTDNLQHWCRVWKGWASALRQEYSVRPRQAVPTSESGCSSWQTPRTVAGGYTRDNGDPEKERLSLEGEAAQWPTPAARDYKGANSEEHVTTNGSGRMHMDQLPNFVMHGSHSAHPVLPILDGPTSLPSNPSSAQRSPKRKLNPFFVEWLMHWPMGWTIASIGSGPEETEFSLWLERSRGILSTLCSPPAVAQLDMFGDVS